MKRTLLYFLFLFSFFFVRSQSTSTKGTEFWVSFMENLGSTGTLSLHFSAFQSATITIVNPLTTYTQTVNVSANSLVSVTVPQAQCYNTGSGAIANKVLKITSTSEITMYAMNYYSASTDGTVVLPVQALGINYRVIAYRGYNTTSYPSEFIIVAPKDSTLIKITASCNTKDGKIKNVPYFVTLNKGQCYQVQSKTDTTLTGTLVEVQNCKPVAVFGGSACTNVPSGCAACDHLYEQLYSINMWGKEFIIVPTATRTKDRIVILADKSNTVLTINGTNTTITNAGGNYEADVSAVTYVSADKPVCIAIDAEGQACGGGSGDPMMMWVTPVEQNINSIIFVAYSSALITSHYVNIVAKTSSVNSIKLNNVNIGSLFTPVPTNTNYSYVKKTISAGANSIVSDSGFTAYAYGYGNYESYGYNVGSSARDLNRFFTVNGVSNDNFSTPATSLKVCRNSTVVFKGISGSYTPVFWLWKFNNDTASTQNVTRTFPDTGLVKVMMITSWVGSNLCYATDTTLDTAIQYIRVIEPKLTIKNQDTAVCAGSSFQTRVAIEGDTSTIWTGPGAYSCTKCMQPRITPSASGWYKATLSATLGCSVSDSMYIHLIDSIHLSISADTMICAGQKARIRVKLLNPDTTTKYQYKLFGNNNFIAQDTVGFFEVNLDTTTILIVKANNGCTDASSPPMIAYVRPPLRVQYTDSFLICKNTNNSFTFKATGGDSSYAVYLIVNNSITDSIINAIPNIAYSFTFAPNPTATYRLLLKDGCTILNDTPLIHFMYRSPLSFTHTPDTMVCAGQNFHLNLKPSGGDSSYSLVLIKNNVPVDSILNASIGNNYFFNQSTLTNADYRIVLKDGCTTLNDTQRITVSVRNPVHFTYSKDSFVCAGQPTDINVVPSGGDSSYTFYFLNNNVVLDTIKNAVYNLSYVFHVYPLFTGNYSIVLTDNCTLKNDTQQITYSFRRPINIMHTPDTMICKGQTIPLFVTPTGGDLTYRIYLLQNNVRIDSIINALKNTQYFFTVSPATTSVYTIVLNDGCTYLNDTQRITVNVRNPLSLGITNSSVICRGQYLNISVTPFGGDSTYTVYLLNNSILVDSIPIAYCNTTYNFNKQPALNANYKIVLKDDCTLVNDTQPVPFIFRAPLSFTHSPDTQICIKQFPIRVTPFGGDSSYTFYLIKNNVLIDSITNAWIGNNYFFNVLPLTSTTYKMVLKDGCTLVNDTQTINLYLRTPLNFDVSNDSFICEGSLSQIFVKPHGGDSTYTIYLLDSTSRVDSILNTTANFTYQFNVHPKFITKFSIVLTDGCTTKNDSQKVVYIFRLPLGFTHTPDTTICIGQTIPLNVKPYGGDSIYTFYLLKNNILIDSINNTALAVSRSFPVTPSVTSTYTVILTDGCTYLNDTQNIVVHVRNPLNLNPVYNAVICRGQFLNMAVTPTGGDSTYIIYLLNNNSIIDSVKNALSNITYNFNKQPALNANYKLVLKDGCTLMNDTHVVNFVFRAPLSFTCSKDSTICKGQVYPIKVNPSGGDSSYVFYLYENTILKDSIKNASIGINYFFNVTPLINTSYKILLKDGCTLVNDSHSVNVSVRNPLSFSVHIDSFICEGTLSNIDLVPHGGDSTYTFYLLDSTSLVDSIQNAIPNQTYQFFVHPKFITKYSVVLTDGCTLKNDTQRLVYTFRKPLLFFHSGDTMICKGRTIPITVTPFGGDSTYYILLKHGAVIDSISDAIIGVTRSFTVTPLTNTIYSLILSDGCTYLNDTQYINVVLRNPLSMNIVNDSIICRGQKLPIHVTPNGGDSTYSLYLLNNSIIEDSFVNAIANTTYTFYPTPALTANYTLVLKDGCTVVNDTEQVHFGFRAPLSFNYSKSTTLCIGQSYPIMVTPFGGDSTYTFYLFRNNVLTDSVINAGIGNNYNFVVSPVTTTTYKIILKDGCTLLNDSHSITVYVRTPLSFTSSIDSFICEGSLSAIDLIPHGGDSTYTFYLFDSTVVVDSILNAVPNTIYTFYVHPKFITKYNVVLTDGCTSINDKKDLVYTFRNPLVFIHPPDTMICKGRSLPVSIKPFGGDSTYSIYLLKNKIPIDSITNATLGVLRTFIIAPSATTIYSLILADGCTYLNDTANIDVIVRDPLRMNIENDSIICRGQHLPISVIPNGGDSTYSLYLSDNNIIIDSINNAISNISYNFNPLPSLNSNYKIIIKDGCTILSDTETVRFGFRAALSFTHSPDSIICIGQNFPIRIMPFGGDSTYTFYLLKNNIRIDSVINATPGNNYYFNVAPVISTTYRMVLKDGCTIVNDTQNINVTVRNPLKLKIAHDTIICNGQSTGITVSANGGDSTYSMYLYRAGLVIDTINGADNTMDYQFKVNPTFKTTYKILLEDGCTSKRDSGFITIDVYPALSVKASINKIKICRGDKVTLAAQASGGAINLSYTYSWNRGVGNARVVTIKPPFSASYVVKADDGCSSSAYDSVYIDVEQLPIVDFSSGNTSGCEPFTTSFNNNTTNFNTVSYLWRFGDGTTDTATMPTHTFMKPGNYRVSLVVLSAFGCVDSLVRNNYITVHSNPQITLNIDPKKVKVNNGKINFITTFKFTDAYDFYFGDGKSNMLQPVSNNLFAHIYTDTGYFVVKLVAHNNFGCISELNDSLFIEDYFTVFVPNVFSPNNKDGLNDAFKPVSTFSKKFDMLIYDRWGQLLYTETCKDRWFTCKGWDGTFEGKPVKQDVYIYNITLYEEDGRRHYERGTVMILR